MVDKLGPPEAITQTRLGMPTQKNRATKIDKSPVEVKLVDDIIATLKAEQGEVTVQSVQKQIILKTLIANFGFAASQEPKFNKMFNHINRNMSQDKQIQQLIVDAIKRYRG